ncbi:DUF1302 domain-containing protein [Paraburkholderia sp. RP-4-7]|uniref:DUF1302 domain-containing protein n=1 Tax=Paraburkholderia polaris TaxID=2728848 RepID=A0A848IDT0_9BURK|nr:DUF1302 family protein [Paraburkholderia polaris]NML97743.1 DUF1302 domain-containing protein [Paraburkholderia polaris]
MSSCARFKKNRMSLGIAMALGCWAASASAVQIGSNPDLAINWDNTISYNLGMRAQGINDSIGNNPLYSESDYKFKHAGDIVTNRVSDLSEFDAVYQDKFGFRVSASLWKDFAYGGGVNNNPGMAYPGVPYSSLNSYTGNHYGSYTERYYQQGADLLDAFVFDKFEINGQPAVIKVGRLTEYWGNALIFGNEGINYGQGASNSIEGAASPGTQAKELAIPRAQVLFSTQITPTVSLAAQYFAEYAPTRLPEGGTYLGTVGFGFQGPNLLEGSVPRGSDFMPNNGFHNDYGAKATWAPEWLGGTFGFYYRSLTETQPWVLLGENPVTGATNYHLSYGSNVKLYGMSLDKQIGDLSTGFEVSYRHNTALNSGTGPLPGDLSGQQGARGDVVNVIANALAGLARTPFWNTGSALAEIAFTQKVKTTSDGALYNGVGNLAQCPSGSKWAGCSTNNSVALAVQFDPQWLQVFPGIDLDAPMFMQYGLWGNTPTLGGTNQGSMIYTFGLHALIQNKYNVTLQYNGYHSHAGGQTNFGTANGLPSGGPSYYATGNGPVFYNDKNWVSLTFSSSF